MEKKKKEVQKAVICVGQKETLMLVIPYELMLVIQYKNRAFQ